MSRSGLAYQEVITGAAAVHWLVDVEIGGYVYRASDDDVEVDDANGTTWNYRAGLGDFVSTVRADGDTSARVVLSADVQGTPDGWPSVLPAPPHGSPCTIRRWVEGQTLDEARVLIHGEVYDCEYDDEDAPLSLSIRWLEQTPEAIPPPQAALGPLTWPTDATYAPDPARNGACYPLVIGTPGALADSVWGTLYVQAHCTPAYLAQHSGGAAVYSGSRIVLGWSPDGEEGYDATTVEVKGPHNQPASAGLRSYALQTLTVLTEQDNLGRWCVTAAPAGYAGAYTTVWFAPGREYWVRWNGGGGVQNEDRTGPMRKAGEIIAYLLRLSGLKVNQGKMAAARARLDRYLLDFAIVESQEDIREFIEKEIGSLIPMVRRTSMEGIWYEALNYFPGPADAVMHLLVPAKVAAESHYREATTTQWAPTVMVARASTIAYTDEPIANTLTLRYAYHGGKDHTREIVVTGHEPDSDANEIGSAICAGSLARYGDRAGATVACKLTHDPATAEILAIELASRAASARRLCAFTGDVAVLETLDVGDIVRVTDTARNITDALAIVMELESTLTQITAQLEILDHLALIGSV